MIARHVASFFAAVAAALGGLVVLAIPGVVRSRATDVVPEPIVFYLVMFSIAALMTFAVAVVIGIPTVLALRLRHKIALRHFISVSVIVAVPIGLGWGWLISMAEPSDAVATTYIWGFALAIAMCIPAYVTYWYVAARLHLTSR